MIPVTITGAIGARNRGQGAYNARMEANGFVAADNPSPASRRSRSPARIYAPKVSDIPQNAYAAFSELNVVELRTIRKAP